MTGRNAKIENQEFTNGTTVVNLEDAKKGFDLAISITRSGLTKDLALYSIDSVIGGGATRNAFAKKMQRYVSEGLTLEDAQRKLDSIHYYSRKEIKKMSYKKEETVVEETVEEVVEETATKEAPQTFVKQEETAKGIKAPKTEPKVGLEATIFDYVRQGIESEESLETVSYYVRKTLDALGVVPGQVEHNVKNLDTGKVVKVGTQHMLFDRVLKAISAKVNIALVGPAGSGKTTAVINAAKALDLPFYSKSLSEHTGVHEFFGYQDAHGNYVSTDFRNAYENGGVWLGDEFDNSNPNVLSAINQASENEVVSFPDKMVERHPDFVCIMAGNTYGHGATSEYVGRNPIDAATLDRFAFLYFGYDEDMEFNLATNKEWCKEVQALRKIVADKKIKTIISPRATFNGAKLLEAGLTKKEVLEMTIYKGMTKAEVDMLK